MDAKTLDSLIQFHTDALAQYRQFIAPAAQHLEEETIKALEELKSTGGKSSKSNPGTCSS